MIELEINLKALSVNIWFWILDSGSGWTGDKTCVPTSSWWRCHLTHDPLSIFISDGVTWAKSPISQRNYYILLTFRYHRVTLFIMDLAILGSVIKHNALTLDSPFYIKQTTKWWLYMIENRSKLRRKVTYNKKDSKKFNIKKKNQWTRRETLHS